MVTEILHPILEFFLKDKFFLDFASYALSTLHGTVVSSKINATQLCLILPMML